jgi:hypothetical protein
VDDEQTVTVLYLGRVQCLSGHYRFMHSWVMRSCWLSASACAACHCDSMPHGQLPWLPGGSSKQCVFKQSTSRRTSARLVLHFLYFSYLHIFGLLRVRPSLLTGCVPLCSNSVSVAQMRLCWCCHRSEAACVAPLFLPKLRTVAPCRVNVWLARASPISAL